MYLKALKYFFYFFHFDVVSHIIVTGLALKNLMEGKQYIVVVFLFV